MASLLIFFKLLFTGIGAFIGWFLGNSDPLVYALIVLMIVDYITYIMRGIISNDLSSAISIKEIFQKILIILLVGVANIIDTHLIESDHSTLRTAVTFFYISSQGLSLLENATIIGVPIPEVLKNALLKLPRNKKD